MQQIRVELDKSSYPVYVERGSLSRLGDILKRHLPLSKVALVASKTVNSLYGDIIRNSLQSVDIEVESVEVPDGKEHKSLAWVGEIIGAFVESHITRHSGVIALGGGVIGNLAGFVAATFMCGIPLVQVPTTLIAQVDSSIDGKSMVNHSNVKNLIGASHHPKFVLIDVDVLRTLSEREFKSGLAEVIKYGMVMDGELFEYVESNSSKIVNFDLQSIEQIVSRSCRDKATVVEQDEREHNMRTILDYGHIIGHSIEVVVGYNSFRHGESVAIGMAVASRIAVNMGVLKQECASRQNRLLTDCGLPTTFPDINIDMIADAIHLNKEHTEDDKLRFILPKDIGKAIIVENVTDNQIRQAILEMKN